MPYKKTQNKTSKTKTKTLTTKSRTTRGPTPDPTTKHPTTNPKTQPPTWPAWEILDQQLVKEAEKAEIGKFKKMGVYSHVSRSVALNDLDGSVVKVK